MLCSTCRSLDFGFVGYMQGTSADLVHHHAGGQRSEESDVHREDDEDAEDGTPGPVETDQPTFDMDEHLNLSDILERKMDCEFCCTMAELFETWATKFWGGRDKLDLKGAKVRFDEYMFTPKGNDGPRSLKAVDVCIVTRNPDFPENDNEFYWTGLWCRFQRCREAPLSVTNLCDELHSSHLKDQPLSVWKNLDPYLGRIRPQQIDFRLLKSWKNLCEESHGQTCGPLSIYQDQRPEFMRFVDVETMSVVEEYSNNIRWIALSYVWGPQPWKTLKKDSKISFARPGALAGGWLPDTIVDAIEVTRHLGERYLWTDSLCIIQDSPEDMARFIPQMDIIYGLATITIVALSGDNAFSGLPGVRPKSRPCARSPIRLKDVFLMEGPPPNALGFTDPRGERKGKYFTRGWTFQELMLSRRLLIFGPETVFWECREGNWREDANWEIVEPSRRHIRVFEDSLLELDYQKLWEPDPPAFDRSYQNLVYDFSRRELGYQRDYLAAFEGILSALERTTGFEFTWGLPKPFLGVALTWPAEYAPRAMQRREEKYPLVTNEGVLQVPYPSWSWAGWIGPTLFQELFGALTAEHAGLAFFMFDKTNTDLVRIEQNQEFSVRERWMGANHEHARAPPDWRGDTTRAISRADLPEPLLLPEIRPIVLALWTSRATRHFDFDGQRDPLSRFGGSLHDGVGDKADASWDQYPDFLAPGSHERTFVIVGRGSLEQSRHKSELVAFMVDRHESGAWTRRTTVTVTEEGWNGLGNRVWELVFLI